MNGLFFTRASRVFSLSFSDTTILSMISLQVTLKTFSDLSFTFVQSSAKASLPNLTTLSCLSQFRMYTAIISAHASICSIMTTAIPPIRIDTNSYPSLDKPTKCGRKILRSTIMLLTNACFPSMILISNGGHCGSELDPCPSFYYYNSFGPSPLVRGTYLPFCSLSLCFLYWALCNYITSFFAAPANHLLLASHLGIF